VIGARHLARPLRSGASHASVARALAASLLVLLAAALPWPAPPVHANGAAMPAPAGGAVLEPRIEAVSPELELLGLVEHGRLTVYVTRYATLEPLAGATLVLEAEGRSLTGKTDAEGVYRFELPWLATPGSYPLLFTVSAGALSDLLTGSLEIPGPRPGDADAAHPAAGHAHGVLESVAPIAAAAAAGLAIGALGAWRLARRRARSLPHAGATVLAAGALLAAGAGVPPAGAHEVLPATAAADSRAPSRLPDGRLFVPLPAQRALGLRTVPAVTTRVAESVELAGTVIADPAATGRVQAPVAGRIEPAARGLPSPGMRVARGETLAWLVPTIGTVERGVQQAQLAELDAQLESARARSARFEQLAGSIPQRDIEQARIDVAGLERRRAALAAPLGERLALTAPVGGTVSTVSIAAGQVVDARDLLLQVTDASRLLVEALAYDAALAAELRSASARTAGGAAVRLAPAGHAGQLREQALPLLFRVTGSEAALAIGQPLRVIVGTKRSATGQVLPAASLARAANGEPIVWVKTGVEHFEARRVTTRALDAHRVLASGALADGERVVTVGASLLSQVR
jgi:hypothetical protein